MAIARGEIVEISFPLPGGSKLHPAIVISNDVVYENEGCFIAVMLSSKSFVDEFTFELENEMFTKQPKRKTQVRCHLLALVDESEVISRHGSIKREILTKITAKIYKEILS
jgi:mRNA-degrading endonuclease toxin of MazEF toxin-antitoxin module